MLESMTIRAEAFRMTDAVEEILLDEAILSVFSFTLTTLRLE
jgi:hypothetical protein